MNAHPDIINATPFAISPQCVTDINGRPVINVVVKATFLYNLLGNTGLSPTQDTVCMAGELYGDDHVLSSYRLEPEVALPKKRTDVIINGHAHPPDGATTHMRAGFQLGQLTKLIDVYGQRFWLPGRFGPEISAPQAIQQVALNAEHAYGGIDQRHPLPEKHAMFLPNPVGKGYIDSTIPVTDPIALPNLEYPNEPLRSASQQITPAGLGFVSASWHPRRNLGGTYDAHWQENRSPRLPQDFDYLYFNSAPADQQIGQPLAGAETLCLLGMTQVPRLQMTLPPLGPLSCTLTRRSGRRTKILLQADTLIINTDENKFNVIWRGTDLVRKDALEVREFDLCTSPDLANYLAASLAA